MDDFKTAALVLFIWKPVVFAHLREYPVQFGFKLIDLYSDLVSSACGRAAFPENADMIPPARESYEGMPHEHISLEWANLVDVFNYLRQGKHLVIPEAWIHLVPKPLLWSWCETGKCLADYYKFEDHESTIVNCDDFTKYITFGEIVGKKERFWVKTPSF